MPNSENEIEVYCPECKKLFSSEKEMLEHHNQEHEKIDEKNETDSFDVEVWEFPSKYLGGHVSYGEESNGILLLYSDPKNKIVFESSETTFEIPFSKIKNVKIVSEKELKALRIFMVGLLAFAWKKKHKLFLISYEDELGDIQTLIFDPDWIEDLSSTLYQLRLKVKKKK